MSRPATAGRVLRLRGLPFNATEEEIRRFFDGWEVEDVTWGTRNGKRTGEAHVRLKSEDDCAEALVTRNKQLLGKRYIELFRIKENEDGAETEEVHQVALRGSTIRLRGLPFSATSSDVLKFFASVPGVDEDGVLFIYDSMDRPSGEAYVCLSTPDSCSAAKKLHKKRMGSRYIELFTSSHAEVQRTARQGRLRTSSASGASKRVSVAAAKPTPAPEAKRNGQPLSKSAPSKGVPAGSTISKAPQPITPAKPMTKSFASIAASKPNESASKENGVALLSDFGQLKLSEPLKESSMPGLSDELSNGLVNGLSNGLTNGMSNGLSGGHGQSRFPHNAQHAPANGFTHHDSQMWQWEGSRYPVGGLGGMGGAYNMWAPDITHMPAGYGGMGSTAMGLHGVWGTGLQQPLNGESAYQTTFAEYAKMRPQEDARPETNTQQ